MGGVLVTFGVDAAFDVFGEIGGAVVGWVEERYPPSSGIITVAVGIAFAPPTLPQVLT